MKQLLIILFLCNVQCALAQNPILKRTFASTNGSKGDVVKMDKLGNIYRLNFSSDINKQNVIDTFDINGKGSMLAKYKCGDSSAIWVKRVGINHFPSMNTWFGLAYINWFQPNDDGEVFVLGVINRVDSPNSTFIIFDTTFTDGINQNNPAKPMHTFFMCKVDTNGNLAWFRWVDKPGNLIGNLNPGALPVVGTVFGVDQAPNGDFIMYTNDFQRYIDYPPGYYIDTLPDGLYIGPPGIHAVIVDKQTGQFKKSVTFDVTGANSNPNVYYPLTTNNERDYFKNKDGRYYYSGDCIDSSIVGGDTIKTGSQIPGFTTSADIIICFDSNGQVIWKNSSAEGNPDSTGFAYIQPPMLDDSFYFVPYTINSALGPHRFYNHTIPPNLYNTIFNLVGGYVRFNINTGKLVDIIPLYTNSLSYVSNITSNNNNLIITAKYLGTTHFGFQTIADSLTPKTTVFPVGSGAACMNTAAYDKQMNKVWEFKWQSMSLYAYIDWLRFSKSGNGYIFHTAMSTGTSTGTAHFPGIGTKWCDKSLLIEFGPPNSGCTCTAPPIKPNAAIISGNGTTLTVSGNSAGNTVDSLVWHWGDGSSTLYTQQNLPITHNYAVGGNYNVCLRAFDICGSSEQCVTVQSLALQNNFEQAVQVYPNPTNDLLNINIDNVLSLPINYQLINSQGMVVQSGLLNSTSNTLSIAANSTGIYYLRLNDNQEHRMLVKVIKL